MINITSFIIEWAEAWNPKKTEEECHEYIEKRYPNAVYGEWEKNENGTPIKRCYEDQSFKNAGIYKCTIRKQSEAEYKLE